MKVAKLKVSINFKIIATIVAVLALAPNFVFAANVAPRAVLKDIFDKRIDLQRVFDGQTWQAKKRTKVVKIGNLENWARLYGWKEYPKELSFYKPENIFINQSGLPGLKTGAGSIETQITAETFAVFDHDSGKIILSKKADRAWPMASITKLMTSLLAVENNNHISMAISQNDEVGGGRLRVPLGTEITFNDLLASALIGSANNAANALSRTASNSREDFVNLMNMRAASLGLSSTQFADPSGIEVENSGTASDIIKLANNAFGNSLIGDLAGKSSWKFTPSDEKSHLIKNTNYLLTNSRYDDLYIMAGKTGYIDEAKWNLVTMLKPAEGEQHKLTIVVLGSGNREASFDDAADLARWTWRNFQWN